MRKVLIADDDLAVTNYLMVFLMQTETYEATVVNDSRERPELLEREAFDAILLDMDMPNLSGMDVLKLAHERELATPIIVLTGVNDVDLAVRALKLGAFDYLTKPADDDTLLEVLDKAIQHRTMHRSLSQMPAQLKREDLAHQEAFDHLPTRDPAMIRLFHQVEKMAGGDLSVLILGDRGTGKKSLARAIHAVSRRREGPFVAMDAAAHDPERLPAELFGQGRDWKGEREEQPGFLEQADGGTLYINNIESLDRPMQIRLNRVIQSGEFYRESSTRVRAIDVRVIAASRHDLSGEAYKDSFDRDLLYHLMVHSIELPTLQERITDLPLIAGFFLAREAEGDGGETPALEPEFLELLNGYDWPGNLQELRDVVANAYRNATGARIGVDALSPYLRDILLSGGRRPERFHLRPLAEVQREHVERTLAFFADDRAKAALALGISPDALDRILEEAD